MQTTRKQILEVLNEQRTATVQEIVIELQKRRGDNLTAVTVRHHLNLLQQQNYITTTGCRHHSKPGRPQHVYCLTEQARQYMPANYAVLADNLLRNVQHNVPQSTFNVILEGVADEMADCAAIPDDLPMQQRLEAVVDFLNQHGYTARYEATNDGYILHTYNCPYHQVATKGHSLCQMDLRLITSLLGRVPRRISLITDGDASCGYFVPHSYDDEHEIN